MAKNTIKVKKYSDVIEEYTATAVAITPGYLLELTSAGLVQAHSSAGGNVAPPMFALEDELQGNGITDNITASAKVQVWIPYRGDMVYALLKDGENVAIGDLLESAGNGQLQKYVADAETSAGTTTIYGNQIVAVALEAVDLSASANTAAGRIIVRIV
jgi:hypothetical protein